MHHIIHHLHEVINETVKRKVIYFPLHYERVLSGFGWISDACLNYLVREYRHISNPNICTVSHLNFNICYSRQQLTIHSDMYVWHIIWQKTCPLAFLFYQTSSLTKSIIWPMVVAIHVHLIFIKDTFLREMIASMLYP